jgi:hypothetical protein
LRVGSICIDKMETVIIISRNNCVAVRRSTHTELIKYTLIFNHITEFTLQGLLNWYDGYRLFGVTNIPYFDC